MAVVNARGLEVGYGDATAVRGVSLAIDRGQIVALVGPNGAGKTTLLRAIAGLMPVRGGEVTLWGERPAAQGRRALARRLAYLPQRYELAFPFSVAEVVLMGRYPHTSFGLESARDLELADAAMARCDVLPFAARRWSELSGGEQRRVLLAQALCQQAELLLLDEPTAALDPAHARALLESLRAECERGATAVVVTHDLNLAVRWADRVVLLQRGELVAEGAPGEVLGSAVARDVFAVDIAIGSWPSGARYAVTG